MSYLSYSAYILNILCIALLQWKSNESIKWLPITNQGFPDLKTVGVFMVRLIKRVPGTPRDSVVNSKLSPWNDRKWNVQGWATWIESIESCHKVPFLNKSNCALLSQNLISIFSPLFVTLVFSWSNKESKLKGI